MRDSFLVDKGFQSNPLQIAATDFFLVNPKIAGHNIPVKAVHFRHHVIDPRPLKHKVNYPYETSSLCLVGFILGILAFVVLSLGSLGMLIGLFFGILAIIISAMGLAEVHKSQGGLKGKGFGCIGLFLGILMICIVLALLVAGVFAKIFAFI